MNRLIAIIATLFLSATAGTAVAADSDAAAPRINAQRAEADRAYVRTVGLFALLDEGTAAKSVLGSTAIGADLERAVRQLTGQRFASGSPALRRTDDATHSVSIGAIALESARDFELADHRGHRPVSPR